MIKNSHSNCEMNTWHINTLNHHPESCNLDLSNTHKPHKKTGLLASERPVYSDSTGLGLPFWGDQSFQKMAKDWTVTRPGNPIYNCLLSWAAIKTACGHNVHM